MNIRIIINGKRQVEKVSVSVVVVPRDRFSTTVSCVDHLLQHTKETIDLIIVLGKPSKQHEQMLIQRFKDLATFVIADQFLNPAQSRNLGLKECKTKLAAILDNDIYVRDGWLKAMLDCYQEHVPAMVVPLILEPDSRIHTAGNDFYVTEKKGIKYAHKILRFHGVPYEGNSNIKRSETDYGELHCQLLEVKTALDLNAFDENIQEVGECDSGLTWMKAGRKMYFEPAAVVDYAIPGIITPEDIKFLCWRWDMRIILKGYKYFQQKWGIDITEHGLFRDFLLRYNNKLGLLPRIFPSQWALNADSFFRSFTGGLDRFLKKPIGVWRRMRSNYLGYYDWPDYVK